MEPRDIKFEDIRKGDRIQTTIEKPDEEGRKVTTIWAGLAEIVTYYGDWGTKEGACLTFNRRNHGTETYRLLDRPLPPLPTKPGTVFYITEHLGIALKTPVKAMVSDNGWWTYVSATKIKNTTLHGGFEITAWEPIENGESK